jgi:hypothetical protein
VNYILATALKKNYNLQSETLFVGCLYKNPDLFLTYNELIKSKYDFYDETVLFYYNCFELMYTTFSEEFAENKINIFMSQDDERFKNYKKYGGYQTIKKGMELADTEDIKNYFNSIKKYSLVREFERKGFPVEKLLANEKFDKMNAEDIVKTMRGAVDKIQTVIGGGKDSVLLGKDAEKRVRGWIKTPSMGIPFPWEIWNDSFRGFRRGKFILDALLTNEGKSRKMIYLAVHLSLVMKETLLVMTNEMSEEDIMACMVTTVINHPVLKNNFTFKLDKPEKEIVLGMYKGIDGKFIEKKVNNEGLELETDEEFEKRLFKESEEYRNVIEVARWIQENSKIYFKEMNGKYSDIDIEMELKKHVLTKRITFAMYDTLKGYQGDLWEVLKQTATRFEELAKELNIGIYGNNQLTDDAQHVDIFDFGTSQTANAKQMAHVLDTYIMGKKLDPYDYDKYLIVDDFSGTRPLDKTKVYYGQKFIKSRTGNKGLVSVMEVDLDRNIWIELGVLRKNKVKKSKKDE